MKAPELDGSLLTLGVLSSSSALRINDIHGNVTIGGGEQPSVTLTGMVNSGGQANAGFEINHVTGNVSLNLNSVASSSDSYLYLARIEDIGGATNVAVAGNVVDTAEGGFLVRRSTGPVTVSLHDYATHNTTGLFGPVFTAVEIEDTASGNVTATASNVNVQGGGGMAVFNTAAGNVSLTAQDITSDLTSLATVNTEGSVAFVARDLTSSGSPGIVANGTHAGNVTATVRDVSGANGGIVISDTTAGNVVITARDVTGRTFTPGVPAGFSAGDAIFIKNTSGTSLLNLSGDVIGADGGLDISGQHGNAIINLGATGSIGGLNGPAISLLADAGTVNQINALGDIFGGIVAGDGNDTFVSDNTWLVGLGGGVASFSLGGGANRIVNNGTLGTGDLTATVGGAAFAGGDTLSDVTLANARFENNGTVTMSNALFAGGATFNGDHLTINGDFAAGAASTLVLDAALGGPGSAADLLTINGNLTGVTRLVINNALPGGGAANLGGIPLVNVFGAADKSNMVLDGGPITSGLFVYDLDFTTGTAPAATGAAVAALAAATPASFFLTSAGTSAIAATLPDLLAPAVSVMSASFDAWIDREGDMRQILARGEGAADGANGLGIWFKGFASERDIAQGAVAAIGASGFSYDRSHKQTLGGFLGGIDLAHADGPGGGTMIFGIMGGYASANVAFGLSGASATFEGPLAGAYASYLNGPFYIDAAIQADFLKMSASLGSAGNLSDVSATSLGVRAETGYRFDVGGMFIDPSLALTYSTSHLNDVSLPGANIDFATGKSLAVRAALRVGKTFALDGGTHVTPSATLGISQEMLGGLASTLSSGGNSFALNSALPGTIFDAGLGLDVVHGNFSAFARANATIGKDVKGFGGKLGVSLRF